MTVLYVMSNTENIIWQQKEKGRGRDLSSLLIQQIFDSLPGASYCTRYFFCLFSPFCMANSFILWVGAQILPPFWVVPDSVGYLFFLQWFYSILPIRHLLYVSCLYVILSHQTEHVKVGLIPLYIPFSFLLGTAHSTGHTGVTQQIFVGWMMARWTNSCWRFVQKCESGNSAPDCNRVGD